jgi:hypothetical protein
VGGWVGGAVSLPPPFSSFSRILPQVVQSPCPAQLADAGAAQSSLNIAMQSRGCVFHPGSRVWGGQQRRAQLQVGANPSQWTTAAAARAHRDAATPRMQNTVQRAARLAESKFTLRSAKCKLAASEE